MSAEDQGSLKGWEERLPPAVAEPWGRIAGHPLLHGVAADLARAYQAIAASLEQGGTLYLCGNGGSFSDALHISGELLKSFRRPRPLPAELVERLRLQPEGELLAEHLQAGLRVHVLGANPSLASAVANDIPLAGIGYAQELLALGRPGDVLLGISTSGRARNVLLAVSLAKAMGITTIGLTGQAPNPLAERVDLSLSVPERETYRVQELHLALYHQLCLMLEAHFFA
ncbi:MAG: SIS domain-containing protein [Anaerolineae bacterium]|nr:SIS domain-containing protein [Anaerolineae bacterium]